MKTLRNLLLLLAAMLFITSCNDRRDFDMPPLNVPTYDGKATHTIQALKNLYAGKTLVEMTGGIIIRGRVVANDISGNLYKQIQLQDETGGITIAIDRTNIWNDIRVGQEIFLECDSLYFGLYGGYPQLGFRYSRNNDGNYSIGQMTWKDFRQHAHLNQLPQPGLVTSDTITLDSLISNNYVGKLVTVKNVYFEEAGQPFATPTSTGGVQTVSKLLASTSSSNKLTARNSSASNFAFLLMPRGDGSVTGVLSTYQSRPDQPIAYQITFRDSLDVSPTRFLYVGNGTQEYPWTIEFALANQTGVSGWIQGYIVGTVNAGINESNPINGNEDIKFAAPFLNNTVVLAASKDVTDWSQCVVVNLPAGSDIRSQVNLENIPGNKGKLLKVNGSLEKYYGAAGLKTNGTQADFELDGSIGQSGVIFNETFGNPVQNGTQWPLIADYAGNFVTTGAGAAQVTYTSEGGAVSVRSNSASSFPGASGSGNAMMAANGATLLINDIATCGARNLKLSFGSNETNATLSVAYKINGTSTWVPVPYTKTTTAWGLAENITITLPSGTNTIKLKFTAASTQYGTRVDDITISTGDAIGAPVIDPDNGTVNPPIPGDGTVFNETFGNPVQNGTQWPLIADYAGNFVTTGAGAAQVTYASEGGAVSVRSNSASSFPGASGAGNAMMAAAGASLIINDIATCGATNLNLSFGSNETNATLSVAYKINGTSTWVPVPYTKTTATWGLVENLTISLPSGTNTIKLKFTAATTQYGTRIDDINISTNDAIGAPVIDPDNGGTVNPPTPGGGDGTQASPYDIASARATQNSSEAWIKGYIVGAVKSGVSTVSSANDVLIGVTSGWDLATNVLLADLADETDYTKCVIVNLPSGKDLRTQVNLLDNPGNFQKQLTVKGILRTYFGKPGLRDCPGNAGDFVLQ